MERLQSTLLAHLRQVADFRKARGQRFSWDYLQALVAAAVAAGQTSVIAMVAWATAHKAELLAILQPSCPRIPSAATWRRLVVHLDIAALERLVAAHNRGWITPIRCRAALHSTMGKSGAAKRSMVKTCVGRVRMATARFWSVWCATSAPVSWARRQSMSKLTKSRWFRPSWLAAI